MAISAQPTATLIAAALGALLGSLSSALIFFVGRRRDHAQRLWERQIELYDDLLRQARDWEERRQPGREEFRPQPDDYSNQRDLGIRFDMFGSHAVQSAYHEHSAAHWAWAAAAQGLADVYEHLSEIRAGLLPPADEEAPQESMAAKYRVLRNKTKSRADSTHELLRRAVGEASQEVPRLPWRWPRAIHRYTRWIWSRLRLVLRRDVQA